MTRFRSASLALATVLCAASFAVTANAAGGFGHMGGGGFGHVGGGFAHAGAAHIGGAHIGGAHMGRVAHVGQWNGHGNWGHDHHFRRHGIGFYPFYAGYGGYYDDYYGDDCYRVYRYGRWRVVCDD